MNNTTQKGEWFVLDRFNQPYGPYTDSEVCALLRGKDYYICKPGATDWVWGRSVPELLSHTGSGREYLLRTAAESEQRRFQSSVDSLLRLCRSFLSDNFLSTDEIRQLDLWLTQHSPDLQEWPGNVIARRVREIVADGVISEEERADLQLMLGKAVGAKPHAALATTMATRLPLDEPPPLVRFQKQVFCFTGNFVFGPRGKCEQAVTDRGGICVQKPTSSTRYLVIGTFASRLWAHESFGRKIESAVALKQSGHPLFVVAEEHWVGFVHQFPPSRVPQMSPRLPAQRQR